MLSIRFSGWAQCRLATDPDPYDEPRGVSGYLHAYAGEPDLDRIIRFQNPPFARTHTPAIGVSVKAINLDGADHPAHPLIGAVVDLAGEAKFEGRNGVVAEDGFEPIAPFHISFQREDVRLSRATVPSDPLSPYREFNAVDAINDAGVIERATGISSLFDVWRNRLTRLEAEQLTASDPEKPALSERIAFIRRNLAAGGGAARFFPMRMVWRYALRSPVEFTGDVAATLLVGFAPTEDPWQIGFWFGGWDADAQSFYVDGTLEIVRAGEVQPAPTLRRPERMTDIA